MPMIENPMSYLRMLKGAPASILWALIFSGRFMTSRELQVWTGYADDNITKGLDFLVGVGWVNERSCRGPWRLAAGMQLPLMQNLENDAVSGDSDLIGIPEASSSSGSIYIDSKENLELELEPAIPINPESLRCLHAAGIFEPKASELARLAHVTPEFIQRHVDRVHEQGLPIGAAIYRIQNKWLPPEKEDDDDERHKYVGGKYRDYINRDDGAEDG